MKIKTAVESADVVFRTGEDGLIHGVGLRPLKGNPRQREQKENIGVTPLRRADK